MKKLFINAAVVTLMLTGLIAFKPAFAIDYSNSNSTTMPNAGTGSAAGAAIGTNGTASGTTGSNSTNGTVNGSTGTTTNDGTTSGTTGTNGAVNGVNTSASGTTPTGGVQAGLGGTDATGAYLIMTLLLAAGAAGLIAARKIRSA